MPDEKVSLDDLVDWLREYTRLVEGEKEHLTELDSAIGDADHGINMDRGMQAVTEMLDANSFTAISALFQKVGMTLVTTVGGAAGPLYGTFFLRFGAAAGDKGRLSGADLAAAFRAGLEGVVARGKAEAGDKTMFDAMEPATEALEQATAADGSLSAAFHASLAAAQSGRDATIPMLALKGRASYLGERSIGHQDPGATSTALLFEAADNVFG